MFHNNLELNLECTQFISIYICCEFQPRSDEVYSIQHYVIKFVSDLQQVSGFFRELRFPPPIKLTAIITEILLKVALNTINQPTTIHFHLHKTPFSIE